MNLRKLFGRSIIPSAVNFFQANKICTVYPLIVTSAAADGKLSNQFFALAGAISKTLL